MRSWVRGAEGIHAVLLFLGLLGPLAFFFTRVAPWKVSIGEFFAQPTVHAAIRNSLLLAGTTAILSTTFAFVFSWLLWRFRWPARLARTVELLLKVPYLLPPFFLAMGWIALAAPEVGYLNRLSAATGLPALPAIYGIGGAIFVEVLWTTALAMIQLQAFFRQYPGHLEDAAVLCGASPATAFVKITFPLARPQLASCLLLTSVSALSAFGVPAMLASPARDFVLTTRIFQGIKSSHDFSQAALLSLALLALTIGLLILQRLLGQGLASTLVSGKATRPSLMRPQGATWLLFSVPCAFACAACILPFGAVLTQSLLRDPSELASFTFEKYVSVYTGSPAALLALGNSLLTAIAAAATATGLGMLIAYGVARLRLSASSVLLELWNFGYALPGTVIAISLLVFYSSSLADTLWILALAYLVKYAAFALRTLTPALAAIGRELEEAAWMSGASPARAFFRILLPALRPALAAATTLAFVPMLSELTMSVLLVGPGTETLGAVIYRLQEYADPGSAAVLAISVTALVLALNGFLKRISKGEFGV